MGKQADEDLAQGILDNIDMDSYRLQKEGEFKIELQQGAELKPVPTEMGGGTQEPEIDYLSNIVKAFNDKFGTAFTNEDKVRKMTEDLMKDVMDDKKAVENINASLKKKDLQNAEITFTDVLKLKMVNHIESNFEVFKEYNDNPEFRSFLAGQMFKVMLRDFSNTGLNK